ncbi:MAG: 5'/3'-nucleotidase SurE [Planctomycetaceae bacterium]|nr:5'/3'-nucleotidase SurE [Planctomycetaceae bacterium]
MPLFLITNDDGYNGPGLAALYQALKPLGDVRVVAPAVCHSAKGHAVNTHTPIRVRRQVVEPFGEIEIVEASPADCVRVGLFGPGAVRPDYVVAGINTGANLGVDLFYSGTAAAAREAAILSVPAIAVSRYMKQEFPVDWDTLSQHVQRVVETLISDEFRLPAGEFWNVNFPAIENDAHDPEIVFTHQGTLSHDIRFRPLTSTDEEGNNVTLLEYVGDYSQRGQAGDCDVSSVFGRKVTATPVDLCTTSHTRLNSVRQR